MTIVSICTIALTMLSPRSTPQQMSVCIQVLQAAEERGLPLPLVASLSWHESRFHDDRTSRAGAVGPLQVLPKFWCKADPCDHIEAGLNALQWYIQKTQNYSSAICRYNAGTCSRLSSAWSKKVIQTARFLTAQVTRSFTCSSHTQKQATTHQSKSSITASCLQSSTRTN